LVAPVGRCTRIDGSVEYGIAQGITGEQPDHI